MYGDKCMVRSMLACPSAHSTDATYRTNHAHPVRNQVKYTKKTLNSPLLIFAVCWLEYLFDNCPSQPFLSNFTVFSFALSPSLSLQPVSVFRPLAPVGRCLSLSPTSGQAAGAGRGSALGVGVAAWSMRVGEAIHCKAQGTVKKKGGEL